jgi:riboflavin synthase
MLHRFIARKGSVTIDGISLTINDISDTGFGVNIVPHTLQVTTLGMRSEGDRVHIEVDQIARYLEQLLISGEAGRDGLKDESIREKLVSSGFIR